MKIKELIELLNKEDPEKRVVVKGYESGYDEVEKVLHANIKPNRNKSIYCEDGWWEGEFEDADTNEQCENVVFLPRKS